MDIQLHTTDELVEELKKRHPDGAIIALEMPKHEARSCGFDWQISYAGESTITLKLANICMWHHQDAITKLGFNKEDNNGNC